MKKINPAARHAAETHALARPYASRLAALGVAVALLTVPTIVGPTVANAAPAFSVTSPTPGSTVQNSAALPALVKFDGAGLPSGDTIDVQYIIGAGTSQTAIYGGNTSAADGTWSATANFGDLAQGSVTVDSVVTAHRADGSVDPGYSINLTFQLTYAPNPAFPFTLTSPGALEVVTTSTPIFVGTGQPGSTITVKYGARSGATATAGTGTVNENGDFSITTDFSALEPGSLGSGAEVFESDGAGNPIDGALPLGRGFSFAEAPVALIPVTEVLTPTTTLVSVATSTGVALVATGFSPDEEVTVVVAGPNNAAVTLSGTRPAHIFASATDGSYADNLVLSVNAAPGNYTVTVKGVRSGRTSTGTFTVTADPTTGNGSGIHLPVVSG